ncbi:hypothetical protein L226DRAFT_490571 [Lentinus tigrinus ALCF2SS1-7]|nr:hypothetical protein L226DRAFT_490571 [Lentinus tigrinus ALCF2SS1-7]
MKAAMLALMRQGEQWQPEVTAPPKRTFEDLPPELKQRIFRETRLPYYQYDPAVSQGANNPWLRELRLRKALPLICKTSYWPGMEILYEDIVIRRMGQISALAQTLRSSDLGPKLALLVKTIRIDSCPVWLPCSDVIRDDLSFILSQCTALSSFSYRPHDNFPIVGPYEEHDPQFSGWYNPTWLYQQSFSLQLEPLLTHCLVSGLRSLDLAMPLDCATIRCIHEMLASAERLESLTLGTLRACPECFSLAALPPHKLPRLRELQIYYGSHAGIDHYIRSSWQMPRLARLTIMLREWASVDDLIQTVGQSLTYLHLYPIADALRKSRWESIESVGVACPRLEHFIAPLSMFATWPNGLPITSVQISLNSPTLRYLDLWCEVHEKTLPGPDPEHGTLREQLISSPSQVPSLRCVRLLATSRLPGPQWKHSTRTSTRSPDWPAICNPALLDEDSDQVLYYRLPRAVVAQTGFALMSRDRCMRRQILDDEDWPDAYARDGMSPRLWRPTRESNSESEGDDSDADEEDEIEGDSGEADRSGDVADLEGAKDGAGSTDDEDLSDELGQDDLQLHIQLTRDDVLASFSSSRDTEAYRHVAVWEA